MTFQLRSARGGIAALLLGLGGLGACSSLGSLGSVLGGVLGGGSEVSGTVRGVDTQTQQLSVRQSNGQDVSLQFDNNTKVVYQNRSYSVTSLDNGDQVVARVQQLQNGSYYTDSVTVTQPVSGSTGTSTTGGTVQSLQGTVRTIDRSGGIFTIDAGNGAIMTVSLMYNARSQDVNTFNSLRTGDAVRFYGVFLSNSRVELRQFY